MTRVHLPGILAMAAIVVASNILVQFLFGQWLTWGAFTYPFAFLVTDLMNSLYVRRMNPASLNGDLVQRLNTSLPVQLFQDRCRRHVHW